MVFRDKIRNNKASLELKLTGKGHNRKGCYKCVSHKKKFRGNVGVLVKSLVGKNYKRAIREKAGKINTCFFFSLHKQSLIPDFWGYQYGLGRGGIINSDRDYLGNLSLFPFMRPDRRYLRMLKELMVCEIVC